MGAKAMMESHAMATTGFASMTIAIGAESWGMPSGFDMSKAPRYMRLRFADGRPIAEFSSSLRPFVVATSIALVKAGADGEA